MTSAREVTAHRQPGPAVLVLALLAAVFAFQLNASMLSPALTTMQRALGASASALGRVRHTGHDRSG